MYTFDMEYTAAMKELKTKRVTNLERQEHLPENRSLSKELKDCWKTLTPLVDSEQHWVKAISAVSD